MKTPCPFLPCHISSGIGSSTGSLWGFHENPMPIPALAHCIRHRVQHWQPLSMKTPCPFLLCHTVSAIAYSIGSHWLHWAGASLSTVQKAYWSHVHTHERHPKEHTVFCHFTGLSFLPSLWSKIRYNYCDCLLLAHSTYPHKCNKKKKIWSPCAWGRKMWHSYRKSKAWAVWKGDCGVYEPEYLMTHIHVHTCTHADADTSHFRPNTICGIGGSLLVRNGKWTISTNADHKLLVKAGGSQWNFTFFSLCVANPATRSRSHGTCWY